MTARAQGWYRDPDDPNRHRWWTGEHWKTQEEHLPDPRRGTRDAGAACESPPADLD